MLFFGNKHRKIEQSKKEAEIAAIKKATFKKVDKATENLQRVNELLDSKALGITGTIFLATGGDKRIKQ